MRIERLENATIILSTTSQSKKGIQSTLPSCIQMRESIASQSDHKVSCRALKSRRGNSVNLRAYDSLQIDAPRSTLPNAFISCRCQ